MKFKTKNQTVDAISVDRLTQLAAVDFKKLPSWVKEKFAQNKLLIGKSMVWVEDAVFNYWANQNEVLVLDSKQHISIMKKDDFFERYEDMFDKNNTDMV